MLKGKNVSFLFLIFVLAAFALGVYRLFELRFETGDVYPPYSSLRKDPLGTGAFFRGLQKLDDISVERNRESWSRFRSEGNAVFFALGVSKYWLNNGIPDRLKTFVATGGRLVATFYPEKAEDEKACSSTPEKRGDEKSGKSDDECRSREKSTEDEENEVGENREADSDGGFFRGIGIGRFAPGKEKPEAFLVRPEIPGLPKSLAWPSDLHFALSENQWRVVYRKGESPVMVERKYGAGTIILASDSFFLSNEALRADTNAGLLAWLVGEHRNAIFDEYLHGVRKDYGIADLALKYRLHGLGAGLLLFALLLVWKLGARLVPSSACDEVERANDFRGTHFGVLFGEEERESALTSLLRRSIPEKRILQACIAEWKKSAASDNDKLVRMDKACAVLAARAAGKNTKIYPVSGYNIISRSLSEDSSE